VLFLGADVLATCRQPANHHVRIHSRYAKLGLATKVTMNGVFVFFFFRFTLTIVVEMCTLHRFISVTVIMLVIENIFFIVTKHSFYSAMQYCVDVAYCYIWSSMVGLSVGLSRS